MQAQNRTPATVYEVRRISYSYEIQNQKVLDCCAAPDGTIWIGTTRYLYRFNGFDLERMDTTTQAFVASHLEVDTTFGDQLMWICGPAGAKIFDLKTGLYLSRAELDFCADLEGVSTAIARSAAGYYWFISGKTLYQLTKTGAKRYRCQAFGALPACLNPKLVPDPLNPDGIWLFPKEYKAYYGENGIFKCLTLPFTAPPPSGEIGLSGLAGDANGLKAWTEYRSVYHIDVARQTITLDKDPEALLQILPGVGDMDQYAKQKGLVFTHLEMPNRQQLFATNFGLFAVRKKWTAFKAVKSLMGEEMRGLYTRGADEWYAGAYNGLHVGRIGSDDSRLYPDLRVAGAWDFLSLKPDLLLLALKNRVGIALWDPVRRVEVVNEDLLRPPDPKWRASQLALCRDAQGAVWVGGYSNLLWAPPKYPLEFRPYENPKTGRPLPISFIRTLLADSLSGLWVGWEKGLLHLVYRADSRRYEPDDQAPTLEGITISHLYKDRFDRLWIATKGSGLACMDLKNIQAPLRWYTSEQGLCNDLICRIESSHEDQVLWLSTHKGLARLDLHTGSFHNFYEDSGFYGNEFNSAASAAFPNGALLFGGVSGMVVFHPDSIVVPHFQHKVVILSAELFNAASGKLEKRTLAGTAPLYLPPYPEYIELKLGTSEYLSPSSMRFRYRLRGASDLWAYTNGEQTVKFIGLPPGDYLFEIQAVPPDGHIGAISNLRILVATPYYETWWFKICMSALVLGIAYLSYGYRLRQLLREQQMRRQIADDLHDDIGNKLNIIGILAQKVANARSENAPQQQDLSKLTDLSRNALRSLHTMIWSVDADEDRLSSLLDRMQDFADAYLRPLNIVFQFKSLETIPPRDINMQLRHHIAMVYQELLTNMVKYTRPQRIEVQVTLDTDILHIRIINHHQPGLDIPYEVASAKRGQESIRRRLERIQGEVYWQENDNTQNALLTIPIKA